ncbi:MAG: hypothetical protein ABI565_10990 [Vicinamibacteria bacterium]
MNDAWSAVAIGLMLFAFMWLLVGALLAHASGWPALAARYPGETRPEGGVLRGQVMGIGPINENNVTYLIPTASGLYIYAMFLFRFLRPPILIPWQEVVYESSHKFLWVKFHKLRLAGGLSTLRVKDKGFRELLPFLPNASRALLRPGPSATRS